MPVDYDRTLLLLSVVEKALGHPQLRPIADLAQLELTAVTKDAAQAVKDLREEEAKAEAAKYAEKQKAVEQEEPKEKEDEDKKPASVGRRL